MAQRLLPESVARFRTDLRPRAIGRLYQGWGHFALTSVTSLGVIAFAASRVHQPRWAELLTIPVSFLIANLAEYFGHKGPMHHRRRFLGLVFRRHTQEHHHFFTHEAMAYESTRDFKMVLFPPVLLLFFLGGIAVPIGAAFFLLLTPNCGWLFVATAMGYFLTYEWLHFAHHLPDDHWLSRTRVLGALRRHHAHHHNLALMGKHNFNITFPIGDLLFGTLYRERPNP